MPSILKNRHRVDVESQVESQPEVQKQEEGGCMKCSTDKQIHIFMSVVLVILIALLGCLAYVEEKNKTKLNETIKESEVQLEQLQYHAQKHKKRINQLETNDEAYRLTMIARDETIVKLEEQKQDLTQKLTDESIIKDTELEKLTEEIKNLKTEKDGSSNKQENDKNEINNLKGQIKVQKKRIITTF